MPFVRAKDITVHYDFSGPRDAPVALLVNSLGANVHMWDEQINALARKHRVLRYDLRGHGLTDTTPGDDPSAGSIERLADDADDARITARTLIVAGAHDPSTTPELAAELQAAIGGSQLEVLHGAAHMLCAEQTVAFNDKLLRFLEA